MPVPTGCLAYFDDAVYHPYAVGLVACLSKLEFGWSGPEIIDDPPRYCLLRDGAPAEIPVDLRPLLPDPPKVSLKSILDYYDRQNARVAPLQLLDILTLISEDLGPAKFEALSSAHPWIGEFMR